MRLAGTTQMLPGPTWDRLSACLSLLAVVAVAEVNLSCSCADDGDMWFSAHNRSHMQHVLGIICACSLLEVFSQVRPVRQRSTARAAGHAPWGAAGGASRQQ